VTSGFPTTNSIATAAARTPEITTANVITRFARTPRRRAVRKSLAAARVCSPIVVLLSRSAMITSATRDTPTARIVTFLTSTPPIEIDSFSEVIDEKTTCPRNLSRRSTIRAIAWSRKAIANVVTSITAGDWFRRGRNTTRSISSENATTIATQVSRLAANGHDDVNASVYAPTMISWP
jgi:hypothetical protein